MKLLLIGDSCKDIYHYGTCERLCPEAPVPIFTPTGMKQNGGMASNVLANLESLGEKDIVFFTNSETIEKHRYIDEKSNQMILRVDCDRLISPFEEIIYNNLLYSTYDASIISDYNKGFVTRDCIKTISEHSTYSFVDTKKLITKEHFQNVSFIKINEKEWEICQNNGVSYEDWKEKLIVTLGKRGCLYNHKIYPVDNTVEVRDVSGAGDTWLASFVVSFLKTKNVPESIEYANKNATIVVQKRGVVTI